MRNFKSVAFIVSTAALLAACSSPTKLNETPVVEKSPTPAAPAAADPRDINPVQTGSVDPLNDPQGVLAKRSIYFDYDSFVVRADGQPVVQNHSAFLTKNT